MRETSPHTYVIVRSDMAPENIVSQVAHVCHEAGSKYKDVESNYLIVLEVSNEEELLKASHFLEFKGVDHHLFYEPDFPKGHTALCTKPLTYQDKKYFRKFRLWSI